MPFKFRCNISLCKDLYENKSSFSHWNVMNEDQYTDLLSMTVNGDKQLT